MKRALITGLLPALAALLLAGCAATPPRPAEALVAEVRAAEQAFARTMAERDHAAFLGFIAEDAVFLNGGQPLHGKSAIGAFWQRFYAGAAAPFAWRPEHVVVAASGRLAQTTGPVAGPDGKVFARFYSTWRLDGDGRWRVVFDDGYKVCDVPAR